MDTASSSTAFLIPFEAWTGGSGLEKYRLLSPRTPTNLAPAAVEGEVATAFLGAPLTPHIHHALRETRGRRNSDDQSEVIRAEPGEPGTRPERALVYRKFEPLLDEKTRGEQKYPVKQAATAGSSTIMKSPHQHRSHG